MRVCLTFSTVSMAACLVCAGAAMTAPVFAAPPITITSQASTDGPIRYTVKVTSKQFGNAQETRAIRSGQSDDYTWKMTPPGSAIQVAEDCPGYASLALDANGAMMRQIQLRLAPVVAADGTANVQLSFQAQAPAPRGIKGANGAKQTDKALKCPASITASQVVRFTMPTNGRSKTLTLNDGTQISLTARR
ncbi:DUF6013 family protein [Paraburkholderia hayleyella]|uniref:DUF6013 family protein n=1 Tax=Paraburkholderia hayleyella TaxID=2152889 RepID=UPI0012922AED|nr:DUF6013 family protein [Paraburkholderia hayleyella]